MPSLTFRHLIFNEILIHLTEDWSMKLPVVSLIFITLLSDD